MNNTDYRFERLDENRLKDLLYLYNSVFKTNAEMDFIKKKYDTGFTGVKYTGFIAYDKNNSPAAYYGVFPLFVVHKDNTFLAAQSGDTMTRAEHRGKGLFYSLATETYKLASELGVKFVFGFPNMNSYKGFLKLKWIHRGYIKKYKINTLSPPVSYAAKKLRPFNKIYNKYADSVISGYRAGKVSFSSSVNTGEYISVKHDDDFFKYKNYSKKYVIELYGKCVYFKIEGAMMIGDIEKCTEQEFWLIIKKLKQISFRLFIPAIIINICVDTDYDNYLSKALNAEENLPVCYFNLSDELDLDKLQFTAADIDTF
jgi:hypothetical protein